MGWVMGSQYASVRKVLKIYWREYGGIKGVIFSPFFGISLFVALSCFPLWINGGWTEVGISVLPAMLGFSLAAYTLSMGIGGDGFQVYFASPRKGGKASLLAGVSVSFLHFILVQIIAIVILLIKISHWGAFILSILNVRNLRENIAWIYGLRGCSVILNFLGVLTLIYACFVAVAAMFRVFRISKSLEIYAQLRRRKGMSKTEGLPAPAPPLPEKRDGVN